MALKIGIDVGGKGVDVAFLAGAGSLEQLVHHGDGAAVVLDHALQEQLVEGGSVVYVPPGVNQSLENIGTTEIEFLCLVDPAWRIEDEQVTE